MKKRLSAYNKSIILTWMMDDYDTRQETDSLRKKRHQVLTMANALIHSKYPPSDMEILSKYGLRQHANGMTISMPDGRVSGLDIGELMDRKDPGSSTRAHVPSFTHSKAYQCTEEEASLVDEWEVLTEARQKARSAKKREYNSFLTACRYVDDVTAIIHLPEDIIARIGAQSSALVAVSQEMVESLRHEFGAPS